MSNFTPLVKRKFVFEGDDVSVTFSRLKRKHMLKMLPKFIAIKDNLKETTDVELLAPLIDEFGDKAVDYIRSIEGLKDANGEDVTITEVIENAYFLEFFADIMMAMIEESLGPSKKA